MTYYHTRGIAPGFARVCTTERNLRNPASSLGSHYKIISESNKANFFALGCKSAKLQHSNYCAYKKAEPMKIQRKIDKKFGEKKATCNFSPQHQYSAKKHYCGVFFTSSPKNHSRPYRATRAHI